MRDDLILEIGKFLKGLEGYVEARDGKQRDIRVYVTR